MPLVAIYDEILQNRPEQIIITSEWLCLRHKRLAGHLFHDWAGRFRDVNVQVGAHTPPPYYEVPIHMRQFCDDLSARLLHLNQESVANCAELLAWADGASSGFIRSKISMAGSDESCLPRCSTSSAFRM